MSYLFRQVTPQRRTYRKECKHYTSYTKTLRQDFNRRCGYCDDVDEIRIRSFTIDHFVPQSPEGFKHHIPPNYYFNLVYSCRYCNSSKSNTWPTNDPTIHNDGTKGFVEPTDEQYTRLFNRTGHGAIISVDPTNELANYII